MKITKIIWASTSILLLAMILGSINNLSAQEKDQKIAKSKLPKTVQEAFKAAYPNAKIIGTSVEKENNVTYYEVESMDGKQRRDFLYTADGKVFEMEEVTAENDLSTVIKETIKKDFSGFKFNSAEKTTKGIEVSYDVVLKKGKSGFAVTFDAAGKVIKKTVIKEKAKEEKDEKEKD